MKYTGRVILLIIFILSMIAWNYYDYMNLGQFRLLTIGLESVVYIPLCWWIGLQYDKAKFFSEKDFLTGVCNRRFVLNIYPKLCALAERNHRSLGFLVLDINNFKAINDRFGHRKGDFVLQNVSQLLVKITRRSDVVARWGGDEFLVIASFTDRSGLEALIQRIQNELTRPPEQNQPEVTVSIGAAVYPEDSRQLDELLHIADQNMYEVKVKMESE